MNPATTQSNSTEATITVKTTGERITIKQAISMMAERAEELGATADDASGLVRALVEANGLGFYAWFCVCAEMADRSAQREGYKNQSDRAWAHVEARRCNADRE